MDKNDIQPGMRVRVIGRHDRVGTVTAAPPVSAGGVTRVQVAFDGGGPTWVRTDNLEPQPERADIFGDLASGTVDRPEALRRNLLHEKLQGRLTTMLYSMEASKTQFFAFQFKPVLRLLDSPTSGLLVADEVGLGKTIEAGLIWTELVARTGASRLMVVCPPHLREKWLLELSGRFGVKAQILRSADDVLRELSEVPGTTDRSFALIASYHTLRPPKGWQDKEPGGGSARLRLAHFLQSAGTQAEPLIDLLVIDEVHYMRNPQTSTSQLGELFSPVAAHKVFLSATPIMIRSANLFTLLNLLDPDTFSDQQTFEEILGANEPLVRLRDRILGVATPDEADSLLGLVDEAMGHPLLGASRGLASLRERISGRRSDLPDRRFRSELAFQTEKVNLLGQCVTRTRKCHVFEHQVVRDPHTVEVDLTPIEQAFYDRVTSLVLKYARERSISAGFLTVMPQRQVSSCMVAALSSWLAGDPEDDVAEVNPDLGPDEDGSPGRPLIDFLCNNLAGQFSPNELESNDTKYGRLLDVVRGFWDQNPGKKIVLFSYFKPTLNYLRRRLEADGISSLLLTGDSDQPKQDIVAAFREETSRNLLLSSEVGSEGLDIQFANALINYDLPWNPMVVEQRIGRLDRIGQEADRILIFNLIRKGTIDKKIYDRLYLRLDLFRRTLGDLEAVIGPVVAELTASLLTLDLTEEQIEERLQKAKMALANNIEEQRRLEEEAAVLAAYGDYIIQQINASHNRSRWVRGRDLEAYVVGCFQKYFPETRVEGVDPESRVFEIEFDTEALSRFDHFLNTQRLGGQTRLRTTSRRRIRFDHKVYTGTSGLEEVIHMAHPLVRFAGQVLRDKGAIEPVPVAARISAERCGGCVAAGTYVFVVQRWSVLGLKSSEMLHYAVEDLGSGAPVEAEGAGETLVETVAEHGRPWPEIRGVLGDRLAEVAERLRRLEESATGRFFEFDAACEAENQDRAAIQKSAVDRFEARRERVLQEVLAKHRAQERPSLARAIEGQIKGLKDRCDLQRKRIERNARSSGEYQTLAIGVIQVES